MDSDKHSEAQMYFSLLKQALTASLYDESAWRIAEMRKPDRFKVSRPITSLSSIVTQKFLRALDRYSLSVVKRKRFDEGARRQGKDWPMFGYTMIGLERLDNIQTCIDELLRENVPGDLIETGVWRGGSAMLMRAVLKWHNVTDRVVWLADSFEGLPKPEREEDLASEDYDISEIDFLKVSLEQVQANFARFGLLDEQVRFLKGWFKDTLPAAPIEKLALLRLDGDLYESTMDSLKALHHKVSPGGFVIVDDFHAWPPCKKAVMDYFSANQIQVEIREIDGAAVYWKIPHSGAKQ